VSISFSIISIILLFFTLLIFYLSALTSTIKERAWLHRHRKERQGATVAAPLREGEAVAHSGEYFMFYHCNYFIHFCSTNLLSLALTSTVDGASVAAPPRKGEARSERGCTVEGGRGSCPFEL